MEFLYPNEGYEQIVAQFFWRKYTRMSGFEKRRNYYA